MKTISVYDTDGRAIEILAMVHDVTQAEVVQAIMEAIEDTAIDLSAWLVGVR